MQTKCKCCSSNIPLRSPAAAAPRHADSGRADVTVPHFGQAAWHSEIRKSRKSNHKTLMSEKPCTTWEIRRVIDTIWILCHSASPGRDRNNEPLPNCAPDHKRTLFYTAKSMLPLVVTDLAWPKTWPAKRTLQPYHFRSPE